MTLDELMDRLWRDYVAIAPQAGRIHALLEQRGERIVNDHIAFRTYDRKGIGLEAVARPFVAAGYEPRGDYEFPEKHLRAKHYEHPEPGRPKVFVSELEAIVAAAPGATERDDFPACGRPWPVSTEVYDALAEESEYAAWVAAFGFRANHFTIDVGALETFPDLPSLNSFLVENGFALNESGGAIKGSPDVYLEQSSTLADRVEVSFSDGQREVPSCYYEFARRYRLPSGEVFQGFVAKSADRLFESTDRTPGA